MAKFFIGGIPKSATESEIDNLFSEAGYVPQDSKVLRDRETNESRGFGFVELIDVDDRRAQEVVDQMRDARIDGRRVKVDIAKPQEPRTNRPSQYHDNRPRRS